MLGTLNRWTEERVGAALQRRRYARDGGAYTALFDQPATGGRVGGVPIAVKDIFDRAGTRTAVGSAARRDAPLATSDAAAVAALRAAGARFVGKTAMHEFAFGVTGVNAFEGTPRNPRDAARIPGGSSSGSAVAVAEGTCAAALGTDTGGSVRIPAALCGVVGVKPSYGLISTSGVYPLSPSLDHVGVIAEDVTTALELLRVLAPGTAWDAPPPRTLGLDVRAAAEASPDVAQAIERTLSATKLKVRELTLPDPELVFVVGTIIMFSEAAAQHAAAARERGAQYGADVRERLILGAAIPARLYVQARREAAALRRQVLAAIEAVDAVVGPTVGVTASLVEDASDPNVAGILVRNTRLWNVTGLPAVSVPLNTDGLPIGLQIVSATDAMALSAAALFEAAAA
jgi:Asp-tRNA(Asn)/Glu-tRNA(Gln) amidotransferase A subunit family amidase